MDGWPYWMAGPTGWLVLMVLDIMDGVTLADIAWLANLLAG
jgi:hypothetical protein